jgi:hypothetical protein
MLIISTSKHVQDILFEPTDNLIQCELSGEHLLSPGPFHSESKFCDHRKCDYDWRCCCLVDEGWFIKKQCRQSTSIHIQQFKFLT